MDTADSASVISSLLHEKKRTQKNLDLRHGLQNIVKTPGLQPELRGLKWNPSTASGADSLGRRKKTQLQMPHRKEEKNARGGGYQEGGSKWFRTVCDSRWSVHIRTRLCWLQRNPLWAEAEGGEKSLPSSCEKPRKATKCVPGGGVRRGRPHAAHFRTPGMGGLDGRWFLNVSD